MTRAERIEEAARALLAAMGDYWLWNGIEHEADGCPEDDTCDCPIVQRYVNADDALRTALSLPPEAPAAPKAPERGADRDWPREYLTETPKEFMERIKEREPNREAGSEKCGEPKGPGATK